MSKVRETPWRRWVVALAGIAVLLKSAVFTISKVMRVVKNEVQARGTDADLLLSIAQRRKFTR